MLVRPDPGHGGWNVANEAGQIAVKEALGDSRTNRSERRQRALHRQGRAGLRAVRNATTGANVLVDTAGYGEIFTDVCDEHPDIYCIQTAPFTKLGQNTTGWFPKLWIIEYTAGVAAGLSTKGNTVGYVLGYDVPLIIGASQCVHHGLPERQPAVRVQTVVTNDYFNPPKTSQAVSTLLDAGADVIRSYTDDQGYCEASRRRATRWRSASSGPTGSSAASPRWSRRSGISRTTT